MVIFALLWLLLILCVLSAPIVMMVFAWRIMRAVEEIADAVERVERSLASQPGATDGRIVSM